MNAEPAVLCIGVSHEPDFPRHTLCSHPCHRTDLLSGLGVLHAHDRGELHFSHQETTLCPIKVGQVQPELSQGRPAEALAPRALREATRGLYLTVWAPRCVLGLPHSLLRRPSPVREPAPLHPRPSRVRVSQAGSLLKCQAADAVSCCLRVMTDQRPPLRSPSSNSPFSLPTSTLSVLLAELSLCF